MAYILEMILKAAAAVAARVQAGRKVTMMARAAPMDADMTDSSGAGEPAEIVLPGNALSSLPVCQRLGPLCQQVGHVRICVWRCI
jgi:hypothetical protein